LIVARERVEPYGLPENHRRPRRRAAAAPGLLRRERLALTGMVLVFFCTCVIIAFYYTQVLITGYRLSSAKKELAQLRKESHDLYTKVQKLSSLENIERIAVHKLGMVKPQNDRVVVVQAVEPAGETAAAGVAAAAAEKDRAGEDRALAGERREQNWVINAFAKMVSRLEVSMHSG